MGPVAEMLQRRGIGRAAASSPTPGDFDPSTGGESDFDGDDESDRLSQLSVDDGDELTVDADELDDKAREVVERAEEEALEHEAGGNLVPVSQSQDEGVAELVRILFGSSVDYRDQAGIKAAAQATKAGDDEVVALETEHVQWRDARIEEVRRVLEKEGAQLYMPCKHLATWSTATAYHGLAWPHDKIPPALGFLAWCSTYSGMNFYDFQDCLKAGEHAVGDYHFHGAHSSSGKDPTFPRGGVFSCDPRIVSLCNIVSSQDIRVLLQIGMPLIISYGKTGTHQFYEQVIAGLKTDDTFKEVTLKRGEVRIAPPRGDEQVPPCFLEYLLVEHRTADGKRRKSLIVKPAHPSYGAYALGGLEGKTAALGLDLVGRLSLLLVGKTVSPKSENGYLKKAFAIEKLVAAKAEGRKSGGIPVYRYVILPERDRERAARAALSGYEESQAWGGWQGGELVERIGNFWAAYVNRWAEKYDVVAASGTTRLARVPPSALEKAAAYASYSAQARPVALPAGEGVLVTESGTALSRPMSELNARRRVGAAKLARPVARGRSEAEVGPSGAPLAGNHGVVHKALSVAPLGEYGAASVEVAATGAPVVQSIDVGRRAMAQAGLQERAVPVVEIGSSVGVLATEVGTPLVETQQKGASAARVETTHGPVPVQAVGEIRLGPVGAPLAQTVREAAAEWTRTKNAETSRPMGGGREIANFLVDEIGAPVVQNAWGANADTSSATKSSKRRGDISQEELDKARRGGKGKKEVLNWGAKTGFFWAGMAAICATFVFFRVPEPKGRTYGELDVLFENRISARKFASTQADQFAGHGLTRNSTDDNDPEKGEKGTVSMREHAREL